MSDCYIEEFVNGVSTIGTMAAQESPQPSLAVQKITIGASTQSSAFNARTNAVELVADGACHYKFGADPTASTSTGYLPANTVRRFAVIPGTKVAVST
jgi:hypothetical protein